jgi:hypothetical protein
LRAGDLAQAGGLEFDAAQYKSGDGPCPDAFRHQHHRPLPAGGGRTPDEAFQLLVQVSRANRKLRDVAAQIVDRAVQRPPG